MSFTLEPEDDEDSFIDDNDNDNEYEYIIEEYLNNYLEDSVTYEKDNLLSLYKWVFLNDISNKNNKFSCSLVLPNPKVLGLEKSYEICEFLVNELYKVITYNTDSKENKHIIKALTNCIIIIEDMIINQLKM